MNEPDQIYHAIPSCLKKQRYIKKDDFHAFSLKSGDLLSYTGSDQWMSHPIDPASFLWIRKHTLRDLFTTQTMVFIQDDFTEMFPINFPKRFVRFCQRMRNLIRIYDMSTEFHELAADRALAARYASRQSDQFRLALAQRLTMWTEARTTPAHTDLLDFFAADKAKFTFTMVDALFLLMEALLAFAIDIVAKGRAAVFDSFSNDLVDRLM